MTLHSDIDTCHMVMFLCLVYLGVNKIQNIIARLQQTLTSA